MTDITHIQVKSLPLNVYKKLKADCVAKGLKIGKRPLTYAEWIAEHLK